MPSPTRPSRKTEVKLTRRQFTGAVGGGMVAAFAAPAVLRGRNLNDKLNIAIIGAGGRGRANTGGVSSENIVALCDVNEEALTRASADHPKARTEVDFRKLFDRPQEFDAVVVSTCEHTHAAATMLALKHKKHVYCEKPLTHDVYEARQIRLAAADAGVTTQMGIQIHATENYRQVVEVLQSGAIGAVREAHVWVSRAWGWQSQEASRAEQGHRVRYRATERGRSRFRQACTGISGWDPRPNGRLTRSIFQVRSGIAGGISATAR